MGSLAGRIGRRNGSLLTATVMVGGAAVLNLASWFLSGHFARAKNGNYYDNYYYRPDVLFMVMSAALFLFGIGVGGEYPLSASLASERAMAAMRERQRLEETDEAQQEQRMARAAELMSSRLLTSELYDDGATDVVEGNAYGNKHSWQTTNTRSASVTNVEQYNVTQQQSSGTAHNTSCAASNSKTSSPSASSKTLSRGQEVIVVFSMQGMGILANSLILTFLLMITKQKVQQQNDNYNDDDDINQQQQQGDDDYNNNLNYSNQYHTQQTLLYIWRIIYAIGLIILIYVLVSRIRHLSESEVWKQDRLKRDEEELERQQHKKERDQGRQGGGLEEGNSVGFIPPSIVPWGVGQGKEVKQNQLHEQQQKSETQLLFKHYGIRLFGTSITWLLWDIGK